MAANAPPKAKRETWSDWFPTSEPKYPIGAFLQMVHDMGIDLDVSTIRFWQKEGILPYPNRRKIGTGTHAMYPAVALAFVEYVRDMQAAGLTLKEIKPRIRGLADTWNNPDPYDLGPAIRSAAKMHSEQYGVPVSQVSVTFKSPAGNDRVYVFTRLEE